MVKYKLAEDGGVHDTETGMSIPAAIGNRHWKQYLIWVTEGGVPDPEFTDEELDARDIDIAKSTANSELSKSDWRVIRGIENWLRENDTERLYLPQDLLDSRQGVRIASDLAEQTVRDRRS